MSWSIRITILYLGFVAIILTLVFTCMGQKVELESKDYYAKELKFQGQIDATNNAIELKEPIQHIVTGRQVEIIIPKAILNSSFKGEVNFFRPSDSSLDKIMSLVPDTDGKFLINGDSFAKGVYKMRIAISSGKKNYYKEEVINFK